MSSYYCEVVDTMGEIYLYERKHKESYSMRVHHHKNYQILYAIEGKGSIRLEGKDYPLEQNGAAVLFPFSDHEVSSDSHLTLLVLEFNEELFQDQVAAFWKESMIKQSTVLQLNLIHANELKLLLRKLLFEQNQVHSSSAWAMQIYWLKVLLLLSQVNLTSPISDANDLRADRLRHYIDSHYFQTLTTNELANKLGISSRHATSIFKEKYQKTPLQYLTEVRMSTAKKLLLESDKDIISISFEVGYESLPTFYRVFKNSVMMSPSQYRQHQNVNL